MFLTSLILLAVVLTLVGISVQHPKVLGSLIIIPALAASLVFFGAFYMANAISRQEGRWVTKSASSTARQLAKHGKNVGLAGFAVWTWAAKVLFGQAVKLAEMGRARLSRGGAA